MGSCIYKCRGAAQKNRKPPAAESIELQQYGSGGTLSSPKAEDATACECSVLVEQTAGLDTTKDAGCELSNSHTAETIVPSEPGDIGKLGKAVKDAAIGDAARTIVANCYAVSAAGCKGTSGDQVANGNATGSETSACKLADGTREADICAANCNPAVASTEGEITGTKVGVNSVVAGRQLDPADDDGNFCISDAVETKVLKKSGTQGFLEETPVGMVRKSTRAFQETARDHPDEHAAMDQKLSMEQEARSCQPVRATGQAAGAKTAQVIDMCQATEIFEIQSDAEDAPPAKSKSVENVNSTPASISAPISTGDWYSLEEKQARTSAPISTGDWYSLDEKQANAVQAVTKEERAGEPVQAAEEALSAAKVPAEEAPRAAKVPSLETARTEPASRNRGRKGGRMRRRKGSAPLSDGETPAPRRAKPRARGASNSDAEMGQMSSMESAGDPAAAATAPLVEATAVLGGPADLQDNIYEYTLLLRNAKARGDEALQKFSESQLAALHKQLEELQPAQSHIAARRRLPSASLTLPTKLPSVAPAGPAPSAPNALPSASPPAASVSFLGSDLEKQRAGALAPTSQISDVSYVDSLVPVSMYSNMPDVPVSMSSDMPDASAKRAVKFTCEQAPPRTRASTAAPAVGRQSTLIMEGTETMESEADPETSSQVSIDLTGFRPRFPSRLPRSDTGKSIGAASSCLESEIGVAAELSENEGSHSRRRRAETGQSVLEYGIDICALDSVMSEKGFRQAAVADVSKHEHVSANAAENERVPLKE